MTFLINVILGIVIGWILHERLPKPYITSINSACTGLTNKLYGLFSGTPEPRPGFRTQNTPGDNASSSIKA